MKPWREVRAKVARYRPQWWHGVCPVCAWGGGFHDDGPHEVARSRIPRELILQPGWHRRGWRRDEDVNDRWAENLRRWEANHREL